MRYPSIGSHVTRRQTLVGGVSSIATIGLSNQAAAFGPWWVAFSAGVAAGWLVEALKNWGFIPQAHASTSLQRTHEQAEDLLQRRGYNVRPVYSGAYSGGEFELSEATQGQDFLALSTTNHGSNTCTLQLDKADTINLGLVAKALRTKGFEPQEIEAAALPIHPPAANRFVGNWRQSPTYMTPSHGTIAWSTNTDASRPNLTTSIRSTVLRADLRFAQLDNGRWTFDLNRA